MSELVTTTLREAVDAKGLPGECVVTPFDALRNGRLVKVTAVLKRTAVFEDDRPFERHIDLLEAFEVGELEWREEAPATIARRGSSHRGRAHALATVAAGKRQRKGWKQAWLEGRKPT